MNVREKILLEETARKTEKILTLLEDLVPRIQALEERVHRIKQANGRKIKKFVFPPIKKLMEKLRA